MRALTPQELLEIWESGLERRPVERGVWMLRALRDGNDEDDPARLPMGRRDARLLALREQAFGEEITAVAACPSCHEPLEAQFRIANIRLPVKEHPDAANLLVGEYAVEYRLPHSLDLLALQESPGAAPELRRRLLERCILHASHRGEPAAPEDVPEEVTQALERAMAEADPQAEVELSLECGSCGHKWPELFDIESFLWNELEAWAARTLHEVHQLAAVYGWNEREILALSPMRRNIYLNLIAE